MADRNDSEARNLQDDRNLLGWKVAAAVVTVVALLALTVTSVVRAPNDVWTIVLPLVAMAVVAMVVGGLVRRRRRRS
jgi:ACR3 family arsenite efflux pump ArsB